MGGDTYLILQGNTKVIDEVAQVKNKVTKMKCCFVTISRSKRGRLLQPKLFWNSVIQTLHQRRAIFKVRERDTKGTSNNSQSV